MKILLTGANGYIGKRLLSMLVSNGHDFCCVVRDAARLNLETDVSNKVSIAVGDLADPHSFDNFPTDFDAAYYLVHSMTQSVEEFHQLELQIAKNFADWVKSTSAKQVIYLGGIVNDENLSKHLSSRMAVEDVLKTSGVPVTVLRAAIIIGSGSASFEIIRDLVEKLPVMIAPKWVNTCCQPIAIRDVLRLLQKVLLHPKALNRTFDIGGPDVLTYKQMMLIFANVRGYRRFIQTVPVLSPRLSSYWLYFVTSTSYKLARSLVDSMKNEVICRDDSIREIDDQPAIPYAKAIELAFSKIEQNAIVSSWIDALHNTSLTASISEYIQVPQYGCLTDSRTIEIRQNENQVLENVWRIGGDRGWYFANWLWEIRGFLDKLVGGVGLRRGRRDPVKLQSGDALDYWRVILADRDTKRLLLYAEMKLPGEAWLEFKIINENNKAFLIQKATFRPRGILGRLYWYGIYPVHVMVFQGMAESIAEFR